MIKVKYLNEGIEKEVELEEGQVWKDLEPPFTRFLVVKDDFKLLRFMNIETLLVILQMTADEILIESNFKYVGELDQMNINNVIKS